MILSTPFSRHNRSHQTWHNGYGHPTTTTTTTNNSTSTATLQRKPAPEQRAPERPRSVAAQNNHSIFNSKSSSSPLLPPPPSRASLAYDGKSSTLNRLDWLRQKRERPNGCVVEDNKHEQLNGFHIPQSTTTAVNLRRNVASSLGHYPVPSKTTTTVNSTRESDGLQIYAPASIASPHEFAHNKRTFVNGFTSTPQQQQQHYAATSVRSMPFSSPLVAAPQQQRQSSVLSNDNEQIQISNNNNMSGRRGRSGRESALGSLFGTLRRKATSRWSSSQSSSATSTNGQHHSSIHRQRSASSLSAAAGGAGGQRNKLHEPIYANGFVDGIPKTLDNDERRISKELKAEEIYAEGAYAIDSNSIPRQLYESELLLDSRNWLENESRTLIEDESKYQFDYQQLNSILINWINDELAEQRIIIKDLREDLYDGQVLCRLIERLQQIKLDVIEVTQNEQAQKYKLHTVLSTLNRILSLRAANWAKIKWTVEGIHQKNSIEIIHLLVTLAKFYRAPIKLPANVYVKAATYRKSPYGQLTKRSHQEQLTNDRNNNDQYQYQINSNTMVRDRAITSVAAAGAQHGESLEGRSQQRDAFDALVEQAPQKLAIVTGTLMKFCNRHLEKINITAGHSFDTEQFSDGLLLVFLISNLEGYFVPLGQLFTTINSYQQYQRKHHYQETSLDTLPYIDSNNNNNNTLTKTPTTLLCETQVDFKTALEPTSYINTQPIEKLHNVNLALQLIEEAGLTQIRQLVRAEDIVNGDLKAILRVLYALFGRYKHV